MDNRYGEDRARYCDLCFRRCRGIYHVIEKGDTLYNLGQRFRVSVSDIMRANPYINVYNLRIGEEICIPVMMPQPREEIFDSISEDVTVPAQPIQPDQVQPEYTLPIQREPVMPAQPQRMEPMRWENTTNENMQRIQPEVMQEEESMQPIQDMAVQSDPEQNRFSEEDSLKEVMEKLGITMEDLLQCANNRN